MKMIFLKWLLQALAAWTLFSCQEPDFQETYIQEEELRQDHETCPPAYENTSLSSNNSRSVFSAYIVGSLDCMDNGAYDQYVSDYVNQENSSAEPELEIRNEDFPKIYLKFMGLDLTDYYTQTNQGKSYYFNKAFCSNLFYMEYPSDWYVGTTDFCSLTFVPEWEEKASNSFIQNWVDYSDEYLQGDKIQVQKYIEDGGINEFLEELIGKPITDEYELIYRKRNSESEWIAIYDLKKGEKEAAEIVVWCNLGKLSARNWNVELTVTPQNDYGRILVFQEWEDIDFSSVEAIETYVKSEDFFNRLLGRVFEEDVKRINISFEKQLFKTQYHEFVCMDISLSDPDYPEQISRQAAVYIPVTESYNKNWVIAFETFPGSKQKENVYRPEVRERIMKTFVSLPYYHQVKKGENLSLIAEQYGENPDFAYEIAAYKTNHIKQPDRIYPGQKIEIPLRILFKKVHH